MPLRKLRNQFALMGVVLTWLVGGVIALVGYRQMTAAVRHEAVARVEEAARVGQRLLEVEFPHLDPNGPLPRDAKLLRLLAEDIHQGTPLYSFIRKAEADGKAEGFALLDEGLCMVSVRRAPAGDRYVAVVWPLRAANWQPDHIREVVFGSDGHGPESATITIFEKDVRIATNVRLPDGRRATGTRVSEEVARTVLGDELPQELTRRESRLAKIREAQAALEAEAKAQAIAAAAATQAAPDPKAQRNFTDPESRLMKDGATKSFVQAYNAQAAVDSHAQIIVAAEVTQKANDKQQLVPLLTQVAANVGEAPAVASADSGYCSATAVTDSTLAAIDLYFAVDRQTHGQAPAPPPHPDDGTVSDAMRAKLQAATGHAVYALRKAIVEPVLGQVKDARGFRRFSFRGLRKVQAEWLLICLTHNLLKLFRAGWNPQAA